MKYQEEVDDPKVPWEENLIVFVGTPLEVHLPSSKCAFSFLRFGPSI